MCVCCSRTHFYALLCTEKDGKIFFCSAANLIRRKYSIGLALGMCRREIVRLNDVVTL